MLKMILMALSIATGGSQDPWTIEYVTYEEGPRTVYEGTVRLNFQDSSTVCMSYCWELPDGRLAGPAISSDPGQPMLAFDSWALTGNELMITWCRTPSSLQTLPVEVPRYFKFYVIRTSFNSDDLGKLLGDWGSESSPWDLSGDGVVDGADIALLLGDWKVD